MDALRASLTSESDVRSRPRLIALGATASRAAQRMFETMMMVRLLIGIDDFHREADEPKLIQL